MPSQDLVATPGGYRSRALVHAVAGGQVVQVADGVGRRFDLVRNLSIDPLDTALGETVEAALNEGWITYATWVNETGNPISAFRTTWTVPEPPATESNQLIYLFNGLQDVEGTVILQPVLQWGYSEAGGGPYWSVGSWYVTSGEQAFHTPSFRVEPGDSVVGVMELVGRQGATFGYRSSFSGIVGTSMTVHGAPELVACFETLEAYNVTQCSDYPANDMTTFGAIAIEAGGNVVLDWSAMDDIVDCGQHCVIGSNANPGGSVELHYR